MLAQEADINYATKHFSFKTFCKEKLFSLFLLSFYNMLRMLAKDRKCPLIVIIKYNTISAIIVKLQGVQ